MTDKRFTIGDRALQEVYGGCIPAILDGGIPCTQSEVLKLLNELHEEVQAQSIVIKGYQERNDGLFKENEQLRKEVQGFIKAIQDSSRISAEAIMKGTDPYDM